MFGLAVTCFIFTLVCAAVYVLWRRSVNKAQKKVDAEVEEARKYNDGCEDGYSKKDISKVRKMAERSSGIGFHNLLTNIGRWGALAFMALTILFVFLGMIRTVPVGHVTVLDLFGKVDSRPLHPGIHLVNPLKDLTQFSSRTEVYVAGGSTDNMEKKAKVWKDTPINVLSKDGLRVQMDIAVWFKIDPGSAPKIYQNIGQHYVDKIIKPNVREAARNAAINYEATDLFQKKREEMGGLLKDKVIEEFIKRGLVVEKVALRDVKLPKQIAAAIEDKLKAQQEAQKMEFKLQKEEKEAERKRIEARGIKDSQDIIQKTLTEEYLMYYYIETLRSLVNSPNNTVMILPADQSLTPMLNVPSGKTIRPPAPKAP